MSDLIKYPRTPHLEGSRLQIGDEDLSQIPFSKIKGKYLVIEEKIDGANSAISFDDEGNLLLQSRGHYLTGGYRERHFNLLKQWASIHQEKLYQILTNRYIMYGEWLYAKHTVYYDHLPHYFLEFDIYDKEKQIFLSTKKRMELLKNTVVKSVPVITTGTFQKLDDITKLIGPSIYKTPIYLDNLKVEAIKQNQDPLQILKETDNSNLMEGLYIKVEDDFQVLERLKYVRYSFLQAVFDSESHWLDRVIIPNKLDKDIQDLFISDNNE